MFISGNVSYIYDKSGLVCYSNLAAPLKATS